MKETKMQTLERHLAYCQKLCVSEDIPIREVTKIKINSKARSRWGLCTKVGSDKFEIEISDRLLESVDSLNGLDNTILHELLHTCEGCFNHGWKWKYYAQRLQKHGFYITRCNSAEEKGVVEDETSYKYKVICNTCGAESLYARKTKVVSSIMKGERYCSCRKCKGKDFTVREICAKTNSKTTFKPKDPEVKKPTSVSASDYVTLTGKVLKGTNMISRARQEDMLKNGWSIEHVDTGETAQQAYDRLTKENPDKIVRIYSSTTAVRGYYSKYAMIRWPK